MKPKLIHEVVTKCIYCPFIEHLYTIDEYKCIRTGNTFNDVNDVIYQTEFPEWCPYDDMEMK